MKKIKFHPVRTIKSKLNSIKANPIQICYGFAFGVFMSTTPLIGFKWLVALPVVWLAKWSKMACMIGILQVNYITGPLFYGLAYMVGKGVCGYNHTVELPGRMSFGAVRDIFFSKADVFISLLAGGLILGIPLTVGAYFLARSIFSGNLKPQLA
ncbi:MAG: DUF2062 domain-containing protein [Bacteroidales bacterium]